MFLCHLYARNIDATHFCLYRSTADISTMFNKSLHIVGSFIALKVCLAKRETSACIGFLRLSDGVPVLLTFTTYKPSTPLSILGEDLV